MKVQPCCEERNGLDLEVAEREGRTWIVLIEDDGSCSGSAFKFCPFCGAELKIDAA